MKFYYIPVAFMALDILTGITLAIKQKKFTSSAMREGLFHKAGSIFCIVFAFAVDYGQTFIDLGVTVPMAAGVCAYIALMECGSIVENIGGINPEIMPQTMKQYFKKLKEEEK